MEEEQKQNYISLAAAAKLCSYSEPYLRLRARGGKLKSIKLGKKWMTTAEWLDDYEVRVRDWRESNDARRAAQASAVFVAAPAELAGNLESTVVGNETVFLNQPQATATVKEQNDILPKNDNVGDGTVGVVFPDTAEMKPMVAVFCDQNAAILAPPTPKRLRELPAAGQILPPPRKDQMKIGDISDYGWFGALLSGAACALLLFLALNRGGISGIINPDYESGQANVSQAVLPDNALTPAGSQAAGVSQPNFFNITENFSAGDPLKEAVDLLARFFKGY